jgi:hypothetical protein
MSEEADGKKIDTGKVINPLRLRKLAHEGESY